MEPQMDRPQARGTSGGDLAERGRTAGSGPGRGAPKTVLAPPAWVRRVGRRFSMAPHVVSRRRWLSHGGAGVDVRSTARLWARRGGPVPKFVPRVTNRRPGRLAVLWDVSGSMEEYVDLYLPWLYQLVHRLPQVGVFLFAAELVEVTDLLRGPYGPALAELARFSRVWSGGTRIGEALGDWLQRFGSRWVGGGRTTLLIISDGWDAGDPQMLAKALRMLYSEGVRIAWMNPLMATPGFAPKTRALRAAQPYVTVMVSGHSPKALLELSR
ncbi:VWA domain-containing protein [Kyrpidia tusciae]|uniref:VWA domain-containing protein n=1 Tax=Kyrpidia tusciae TaxID=33943 RepID=UPI0002DE0885|nr:VWA domain-containing protein [Kyrpidia tusciae]